MALPRWIALLSLLACACVRYGFEPRASEPPSADRGGANLDAAPRDARGEGAADRALERHLSDGPPGPTDLRRDLPTAALSWTPTPPLGSQEHLYGVWGRTDSDRFATGYNGTLLRFSVAGGWKKEPLSTVQHLYQVWGTSTTVWLVGNGGTVLQATTASPGWLPSPIPVVPPLAQLVAIHGSGPSDVWIVGMGGIALHHGPPWSALGSLSDHLASIWVRPQGEAFALAGIARRVYRFPSASTPPVIEPIPGASAELAWITGCPTGELLVCGLDGQVFRRSASAASWTPMPTPSPAHLQVVACRSASEIYVAGATDSTGAVGVVLRWNGAIWKDVSPKGAPMLNALWIGQQVIVAVGRSGTILEAKLP